jgi:hypothetical protein
MNAFGSVRVFGLKRTQADSSADRAAAMRAIGTRNGEHDT